MEARNISANRSMLPLDRPAEEKDNKEIRGFSMRVQEIFFEQQENGRRLEVIKTYDALLAREAFAELSSAALDFLVNALDLAKSYDLSEIPEKTSPEFEDFLWEEVLDCAREDGNVRSFFIVRETDPQASRSLYVSPDWPSAEAFAKTPTQS